MEKRVWTILNIYFNHEFSERGVYLKKIYIIRTSYKLLNDVVT